MDIRGPLLQSGPGPTFPLHGPGHEGQRDLNVGDVVLVLQDATFKEKFRLARVSEVFPGKDGRVRKVSVEY